MLMSSKEGSSKKVPKSGIGCHSLEVMDSGGYSQCSKHLKAIQSNLSNPSLRELSLRWEISGSLVLSSPHHERTLAAAAGRRAKESGLFFKFSGDTI